MNLFLSESRKNWPMQQKISEIFYKGRRIRKTDRFWLRKSIEKQIADIKKRKKEIFHNSRHIIKLRIIKLKKKKNNIKLINLKHDPLAVNLIHANKPRNR